MILKYGSYAHPLNEAAIFIAAQALTNEAGQKYATRERWTIQGRIEGDSQTEITTNIQALQSAYSDGGRDLVLCLDDGTTETAHRLKNSETTGGVRIVSGPEFPQGTGAEYSTFRTYQIVVEGDKPNSSASSALLEWSETLSFQGGGPEVGFLLPINGLPVPQLVREATPYRVIQTGQAIGYLAYPFPAQPIWPAAEHVHLRQVNYTSPRRTGAPGQPFYTEFPVNWNYFFESVAPLLGAPTPWIG